VVVNDPTGTDNRSITVHVPLKTRMRGGRKIVIVPDGVPQWNPVQIRIDNKLIRALARAYGPMQPVLNFAEPLKAGVPCVRDRWQAVHKCSVSQNGEPLASQRAC
jgi:hypothetical protein